MSAQPLYNLKLTITRGLEDNKNNITTTSMITKQTHLNKSSDIFSWPKVTRAALVYLDIRRLMVLINSLLITGVLDNKKRKNKCSYYFYFNFTEAVHIWMLS